jgi:hypothetical protein
VLCVTRRALGTLAKCKMHAHTSGITHDEWLAWPSDFQCPHTYHPGSKEIRASAEEKGAASLRISPTEMRMQQSPQSMLSRWVQCSDMRASRLFLSL